jgi:hypothetical protein
MRNHVKGLVGTDDLGNLVLDLFTGSLASTTYINYGTGLRRFTVFATKRASPRYRLLRPTCSAFRHNSPERELSQPAASNPTSQRSTHFFETTVRSRWRWVHF